MPRKNPSEEFGENIAKIAENIAVGLFKTASLACAVALMGAKRIPWARWDVYLYGLLPIFLSSFFLTIRRGGRASLLVSSAENHLYDWQMEILTVLPWTAHCLILFLISIFAILVIFGIKPFQERKAFQEAIDALGLKTGTGRAPKVASITDGKNGKKTILISSYGIGPEAYKSKIDNLQSSIEGKISAIGRAANPTFVEIAVTTERFPEKVEFCQYEPLLLDSGQFLIGETDDKVVSERIEALPHLLIAGTTGGGKSVFFKQTLLGLLTSTDHLQMYLIDLKGGLEFREFGTLPNVEVVKTVDGAVALLKSVKREMEARFRYLEEGNKDKIIPRRDRFDRIVVGIDEASVLYAETSPDDEDHGDTAKARYLTEHIAKLSRAAGIHLIMATQRVTKETVDTRIQENISARMCFKLNTLEGSLRVLGNKSACELPAIPGRGIWSHGIETLEVQAPHIDNKSLRKRLEAVGEMFKNGKRKLHRKMLGAVTQDCQNMEGEKTTLQQKGGGL